MASLLAADAVGLRLTFQGFKAVRLVHPDGSEPLNLLFPLVHSLRLQLFNCSFFLLFGTRAGVLEQNYQHLRNFSEKVTVVSEKRELEPRFKYRDFLFFSMNNTGKWAETVFNSGECDK
jgi:hypothetical protein